MLRGFGGGVQLSESELEQMGEKSFRYIASLFPQGTLNGNAFHFVVNLIENKIDSALWDQSSFSIISCKE